MASSTQEQTYFLSKLLNQGGCLKCLKNENCDNKLQHNIPFSGEYCKFIKYPTNVIDIKKSIDDAKINLEGKKPIYTICNYINKNCKNCEEGRYIRIKFNTKYFVICFSLSTNDRITFGMHIDLKLVLKGTKFNVIGIPFDMKLKTKEISIKEAIALYSLNNEKSVTNMYVDKSIDIPPVVDTHVNISVNKSIDIHPVVDTHVNISVDKSIDIPPVVDTHVNISVDKSIDLSTVLSKDKLEDESSVYSNRNRYVNTGRNFEEKNRSIDSSLCLKENAFDEKDFPTLSPTFATKEMKSISPKTVDYSKINNSLKKEIIEIENFEKKRLEYEKKIVEKEEKIKNTVNDNLLYQRNRELEVENIQLKEKIKNNDIKYQTFITNKDIYNEIFANKAKINTLVYETFESTHYSEYKILYK